MFVGSVPVFPIHDSATSVSVILPTFNRRDLVQRALRSILAQTSPVSEIIVIDDGSTDGTREALKTGFGDRIQYVWQENRGVAAARNRGLQLARGSYLAWLDSDDEWLPAKTKIQVEWLESHPDFGLVLSDVIRVFDDERTEVFHRRDLLPEDGDVFKWVILAPNFVPASAMLRRSVYESIGGFDETFPTGEDLDYHLRISARWKVGIVAQPLVRARRGHSGLSQLPRSYEDYVRAIEAAVVANGDRLTAVERRRALARAYAHAARGMVWQNRPGTTWSFAQKAWRHETDAAARLQLLALLPLTLRRALARRLRPRSVTTA